MPNPIKIKYQAIETEAVCLKAVESDGEALWYVLDRGLFSALAARFAIDIEF